MRFAPGSGGCLGRRLLEKALRLVGEKGLGLLLPGMTPDDRIFDRLAALLPNVTVLDWLEPQADESLAVYAERLAAAIPTSQCFIGGVSFGGIVALELSQIICPRG